MKAKYMIIAVLVLASCGGSGSRPAEEKEEKAASSVTIDNANIEKMELRMGPLMRHVFKGNLTARGVMRLDPQNVADVSPLVGANVEKVLVREGQHVSRGQVLATLAHPDIVDLQGRWLTACHRMEYVAAEYKRQGKLYSEHIGAAKNYEQTASEYNTLQDELLAVGEQLRMLGISTSQLKKGNIVRSVAVRSPISGSVENVNVSTGEYASPQTSMFKIVDASGMFADLTVYGKQASSVKAGQSVTLKADDGSASCQGVVASVGGEVDSKTKGVHLRVRPADGSHVLLPGMYVTASVATASDEQWAVPEKGVVDEEGRKYVFTASRTKSGVTFRPVEVNVGRIEDGYAEILSHVSLLKGDVALNRAYYLMSEMKKDETGEE